MQRSINRVLQGNRPLLVLVVLTLVASAIHFSDNAFQLDLYPGPVWLTRNIILAAWLLIAIAAYLAYRSGTRWAFSAYGALGYIGLAHYLMPHSKGIPLRCTVTIGAEALTSVLLIAYVFLRDFSRESS